MSEPTGSEKLGELPRREGDEVTGMAALKVIGESEAANTDKEVDAKATLELLKGGAEKTKGVKKRSGAALEIAGQEIVDVQKTYEKLREALALVKKYLGNRFDIRLEDMFFKKLPGEQVGESTERGEEIDPVLLLHPAMRLAHVIAHELAHNKKKIMNEAVVEAYVHLWFGEDEAHHGYEKAIEKYEEFAQKFAKNGDKKTGVKEIYELYYARNFAKIYGRYEEILSKGVKLTDDELDAAYVNFKEIFPELNFKPATQPGPRLELKHPQWPEQGPREPDEPEPTETQDINVYREKVEARRAEVKRKAA